MTSPTVELLSCAEVVAAVWRYLDDELDGESHDRIREHLALCDHCMGQYTFDGAFLRAVSRALDSDGELVSLLGRVERAMAAASYPRR